MKSKRSCNKRTYAEVSAALVEAAKALQAASGVEDLAVVHASKIFDSAMEDFDVERIKHHARVVSESVKNRKRIDDTSLSILGLYIRKAEKLSDSLSKARFFIRHKY